MKYFSLLVFTALLSACHSEYSESEYKMNEIEESVYLADTDCLKLYVISAFFNDYDKIEILGYIENISEEKFVRLYLADDYLCRGENERNDTESLSLIQLWWENFLFVKDNDRWNVLWGNPPKDSQFRSSYVMIQPRAKLSFRITRLPVNGVYAGGYPERRLKKLKNADFKIIYDMGQFPLEKEKGNSNKSLESNVFKIMPTEKSHPL